jgi:shikimate kinase
VTHRTESSRSCRTFRSDGKPADASPKRDDGERLRYAATMTMPHLVLMGLRGSGKSTLGAIVASRLGRVFIDLDDRTPRLLRRASVAEAWSLDGEAAFRAAETQALRETLAADHATESAENVGGTETRPPGTSDASRSARPSEPTRASSRIVLALGGGTPTAPGAADLLRDHQSRRATTLVYLRASADELRRRLSLHGPGANRPSLTGAGALDEIEQVLARRDPLYASLADSIIDVAGKSQDQCADELVRLATCDRERLS